MAEWTKSKLPQKTYDGESISALLTSKNNTKPHRPIYYHNYVLEGVKDGDWKLRITKKDNKELTELYNLSWDPAERVNLIDDAKYADQKAHLMKLYQAYPGNSK